MSDWLDEFRFAGAGLNEDEKSLMRFAMTKERQRIIKMLEEAECQGENDWCGTIEEIIRLIKGQQK